MLKLNVGLSRKVGEANFGSRGASVNLEIELESGLVGQDGRLQERIRSLFHLAKGAVDAELNGNGHAEPAGDVPEVTAPTPRPTAAAGQRRNGNGHQASEKQLSYARQLASQIDGLGVRKLESLAQRMFGKPVAGLTTLDASGLIDCMKSIKAGTIDLAAALNGAAT